MNGIEYATPRKAAYPAYIALLLAVAIATTGVLTKHFDWLLVAVFPLLLGIFLWLVSRYQIRLRLGPKAIEIQRPKIEIPYDEIVAVRRSRWRRSGQVLAIASNRWLLQLPDVPGFPVSEIENHVLAHATSIRTHEAPTEMKEYVQQQLDLFGPSKVIVIPTRKQISSYEIPPARYRRNAIFLALFISAVLWIPAADMGKTPFGFFAVLFLFISFFGFVLSRVVIWNSPKKVPLKLANSCLVFSPQGLAMMQGDYQGVLLWADVRGVMEAKKDRSLRIGSHNTGVLVKLNGADLPIDDVYQESPQQIATRIQQQI